MGFTVVPLQQMDINYKLNSIKFVICFNSDWSLCVVTEDVSPSFPKTQAWSTWSFSWFAMVTGGRCIARVPTRTLLEAFLSRSALDPQINNYLILLSIIKAA